MAVENVVHIFDPTLRRWTIGGLKSLEKRCTSCLHNIFGRGRLNQHHGVLERTDPDDAPDAMKLHGWLVSVRLELLTLLQGQPREYDKIRHLVQFRLRLRLRAAAGDAGSAGVGHHQVLAF